MAYFCKHGNEPSSSIKGGEFLDFLSEHWDLRKDFVPWNRDNGEMLGIYAVSCNCTLSGHHTMKAYWGSGSIIPRFL
jgi:hypothetical protein